MPLASVSLDDKYRIEHDYAFLTGVQTLARLPMLQQERDRRAGLNTAGYVSGYRGSPLAGLDQALTSARPFLDAHRITFQPGVNEELAATAAWGTQQLHLFPDPRHDGVFAMWYGKGPGVDRCGDVFRHANYAGTARHGGVLVIAGDDHAARSSAVAHQTEHVFSACGIPVLAPADLQEYLDLGLHGWAMSRYAGVWVAMKVTADTVESSASVYVDPERVQIAVPQDFVLPPDGLHIRWPDPQLAQELRMQDYKVYAALAYARANRLNHTVIDSPRPRLGIIASGKAYQDVRQALDDLGIDDALAAEIGVRLYKVGMVWPLEADGVRQFAEGLEEIVVVEEKRQLIEYQLKEMLYNWREDVRPRVVGKFTEAGEWTLGAPEQPSEAHMRWLLPPTGELTPALVARALAARIGRFYRSERMRQRLAFLEAKEQALARPRISLTRMPYFCSGCPHNRSTVVPEGSAALGGVGCHLMAVGMSRNTLTICQMGGEGAAWMGLAPHSGTRHVFANLGDGTYYHSGLLAIRAAVAAKVNITYKILYNDAVAMTGGQPLDGPLTVPQITRQLEAEGVARIVVVSDDPQKYGHDAGFALRVEVRHRDDLDAVQRALRDTPGVTALIYDQTCAAEKRRRRKRGSYPDPARRIIINDLVCEGCGDCSIKSNCLSVVPMETEFGRKRAIDQFTCNKDYSCLAGFCPSLVTVEGGRLRRAPAHDPRAADAGLPPPAPVALTAPYGILITGVGGTGVVTIGALIGMAAHLEGKGVTVLDMTGLAQKGGAVTSHVRIAAHPGSLHATRIATGEADLVLGCDLVVTASDDALAKMQRGRSHAVVNTAQTITGAFVRDPDAAFPLDALERALAEAVGEDAIAFVEAARLTRLLTGNTLATNVFLLGYAFQHGWVPVSAEALERAIELNGAAVDENLRAFAWGRRAAHDPDGIARLERRQEVANSSRQRSKSLDEAIARRYDYLVGYQDAAYAARYRALVERVRRSEDSVRADSTALSDAVARNYFKLLAYKDEYEVARLHVSAQFRDTLEAAFEGDFRLRYHFTLPWARPAGDAEPRKRSFGGWVTPLLRLLAAGKHLRGTPLDPFGGSPDRVLERRLVADYEALIDRLLPALDAANLDTAVALARLPEKIRGFGPVKAGSAAEAQVRRDELLAQFRARRTEAETLSPAA